MQKEYVGKTKNSFDVYFDKASSHAVTHFADSPKLFGFVKQTLPTIEVRGNDVRIEKDMEEEVGTTDLVETSEHDEIVYAKRPRRERYSRFVKNKKPVSTSWITIALKKSREKEYDLYTAFVGRLTPSFPGGDYLPDQSVEFWSTHALVWGTQETVPGSETTECPW